MTEALSRVLYSTSPVRVVSGDGLNVTADDGTSYVDFTSGIGVTNTGHCHPHVVDAIKSQAENMIHAQVNCYRHPIVEQLASRLSEITPPGIESFFFSNSGAEAIEAAIKLAKQVTGRPNVIAFERAFHGRTHMAMALTSSKVTVRAGYSPLPAGVHIAPIPYRPGGRNREAEMLPVALEQLRELLETRTHPSETAAMIIEPVIGEGGYIPIPHQYLNEIRQLCSANKILLIIDEVQTGFGRTGRLFAVEHFDITPDILVMAKGMGSGFPISAIGASQDTMDAWPVGSHGGTYGGNPIGCAAALATIDVLTEDGFLQNVERMGAMLRERLERFAVQDEGIVDVRGLGLMVGVEFSDPERVGRILTHCREKGRLLLLTAGHEATTIRWIPPLVAGLDDIERAVDSFIRACSET